MLSYNLGFWKEPKIFQKMYLYIRNPSLSFRKISDSLGGVHETSVQKTIKFLHPNENPFGLLIGGGLFTSMPPFTQQQIISECR